MDSKAVNKLIRSEIWPLLREQGFTQFDARNAWRYKECFVEVINFQSFNRYLADGIGCTTFSFGVNLGVLPLGGPGEDHIKKDKLGLLLPHEYQCPLRRTLKKRTPVDGFARDDIFLVDPEGHTIGPCIHEVQYLLENDAATWFEKWANLDQLLAAFEQHDGISWRELETVFSPGSYGDSTLHVVLLLLRLKHSPSPENHLKTFNLIQQLAETSFRGRFALAGAIRTTSRVIEVGRLYQRLSPTMSEARTQLWAEDLSQSFLAPVWHSGTPSPVPNEPLASGAQRQQQLRREVWPELKAQGFTDFGSSVAYRRGKGQVDVVEIQPVEREFQKRMGLPTGCFSIALGIYWPELATYRAETNHAGNPRPRLSHCHLWIWLLPARSVRMIAPAVFSSLEDGRIAIETQASRWFSLFGVPRTCLELFDLEDWQLFVNYPLLCGIERHESAERHWLRACLHYQLTEFGLVTSELDKAEVAAESMAEHKRTILLKKVRQARQVMLDSATHPQ